MNYKEAAQIMQKEKKYLSNNLAPSSEMAILIQSPSVVEARRKDPRNFLFSKFDPFFLFLFVSIFSLYCYFLFFVFNLF